jgi:hypothetical protein
MFVPDPIDRNYVPYTKRPVLRSNAALFVDSGARRKGSAARAVPQQSSECVVPGTRCGMVYTSGGQRYQRTCGADGQCDGPLVPV